MIKLELLFLIVTISPWLKATFLSPILEFKETTQSYFGTIHEHSLVVNLEPALKIKNKDDISKEEF